METKRHGFEEDGITMTSTLLQNQHSAAFDRITDQCGAAAVGSADIAGVVEGVMQSSKRMRADHESLKDVVRILQNDQTRVGEASNEARALSDRAIDRLAGGKAQIEGSLKKINHLISLVEHLSHHVTRFGTAMTQVRQSSDRIGVIADTTNILAMNANIEAQRAGEEGKTFAVVAGEVKSLSSDARNASREINRTIESLEQEANSVVAQLETSQSLSDKARNSVSQIEGAIDNVVDLVSEVDQQNDMIARSSATISDHVIGLGSVVDGFDAAATSNENRLANAHNKVGELELTANAMFDGIVKAGFSSSDSHYVAIAIAAANRASELAHDAIEGGEISLVDALDRKYVRIGQSDPPRFSTRLTDWIVRNWQPLLDGVMTEDKGLVSVVCVDEGGHLAAHLKEMSQQPTGDAEHDALYCRMGRIYSTWFNKRAAQSSDPYIMSVYRRDRNGQDYGVVRSVHVPIMIGSERWGNLQLSYVT